MEVIGARWDEFDLEEGHWTIPADRMKMRQPHTVPLPAQAIELLRLLRSVTGACGIPVAEPHAPQAARVTQHSDEGIRGDRLPEPHAGRAVRVTGRTILGEQGHPRELLGAPARPSREEVDSAPTTKAIDWSREQEDHAGMGKLSG